MKLLFPFWVEMAVPCFMIISGFVYSKSFNKHGMVTVGQAYSSDVLMDKAIRYTVPFSIAFLIDIVVCYLFISKDWSATGIIASFFAGGWGQGSFYYPVIMQFIFWFPVLFFIIKKYDFKGFLLCIAINFSYEFLKSSYGMTEGLYRLLVFRYTMVIAFGIYLAIGKKPVKKWFYAVCAAAGIVYTIVFRYLGFTPFITKYWIGTSFWACLFFLPLASLLIKSRIHFKPVELLGKASYNIFLVQMVYYNAAYKIYDVVPNRVLQIVINLVICCAGGLIFYYIETPLTKAVKNLYSKLKSKIVNRKLIKTGISK